nr:poly [ADP-ribose] polymerase 2-B-like isoform X12 [Malus domestica]
MASKLNVEELRNQLAQRGLPTTGAKPTLVRRLDSALREEKKQPTGASDGSAAEASLVSRKREGKLIEEEGGGESTVSEKMKATEKFSGMSVKQLREEAALCGVSATGSKKELLERLSKHSDGIPLGKANEEGNGSKEKIVNATKKGMTVLDQWLPDDIKADYHVLQLVEEKNGSALGRQPLETQLEPCIANFISLIFNIDMMKPHVMEIVYNADKLPLGKLSKSTILKGYNILQRISDVIGSSNRELIEQLSGEFYTVIPHDFGFKKMHNFVIDTPQKLKHKLEMVEALGEIEVATKLLKDDTGRQGDPLYSCYRRLHCELTPVGADSHEFDMITKYMRNTHAKTHSTYTVDIVQIFRTSKEGEVERFRKFSSTKNRMLLWHGSRLTNWVGILSQGLLITPPEAPVTGHMFGKGVYFADMFSKSAKYCHGCTSGVLLLCEVALGDMAELLTAKYDADKLPVGKLSTKGVGGTEPDFSEAQLLDDGVVVPLGKQKENTSHEGSLRYNEYIVYNVEQIRMRYVVQVNFNFKND